MAEKKTVGGVEVDDQGYCGYLVWDESSRTPAEDGEVFDTQEAAQEKAQDLVADGSVDEEETLIVCGIVPVAAGCLEKDFKWESLRKE